MITRLHEASSPLDVSYISITLNPNVKCDRNMSQIFIFVGFFYDFIFLFCILVSLQLSQLYRMQLTLSSILDFLWFSSSKNRFSLAVLCCYRNFQRLINQILLTCHNIGDVPQCIDIKRISMNINATATVSSVSCTLSISSQ